MPDLVIVIALVFVVAMIAASVAVLQRADDVLERIVAFELITVICISLLALLSYLNDVSYYLDAALALAALSFIATLAVVRSSGGRGPFR